MREKVMDAKITKIRLSRMLSYDWIKIVLFSVVAIIVWTLVFTTTATRITPAQQFTVFNYAGNTSLSNKYMDAYETAFKNGVFSYEVIEVNNNDLSVHTEYLHTIMEARTATNEGDVLYVSMENDPASEYKDGEEVKYLSYYQTFLNRWFYNVKRLDGENGYFAELEAYLNIYYTNGYEDADSLNKKLVENVFRARVKENKDKRFRKESQIQKGVLDEIERIEKYRDALVDFYSYIDAGYVSYTEGKVLGSQEGEYAIDGIYAINICPNPETMGSVRDYVSYRASYVDENGNTQYKTTAENMQIVFLDLLPNGQEIFMGENLLYLNSVIESYCTALQAE
jgi:hypothetical protein